MYGETDENLKEVLPRNCFVCDVPRTKLTSRNWKSILLDTTKCSNGPICTKIGDIIGDTFKIYVTRDDQICTKCENIINEYDNLIMQVNKIKQVFMELLHKKYNFQLEEENDLDKNSDVTNNGEINFTELKIENYANNFELCNNYEFLENEESNSISKEVILLEPADTNNRIQTIFKCSRCQFVTNVEHDMKNHIAVHPDTSVLCVICQESFKTRESLKEHLTVHDDVSCPSCTMIFPKPYMLRSHILTSHSEFFCIENNDVQDHKIDQHSISIEGMNRLQNSTQDDAENGSQDEVSAVKEGDEIFQCKYCKKKIDSQERLERHEAEHARFKKGTAWSCPMCPKKCHTRSGVVNHLASHTGDFKYYCEVCKKGFMSPAAIKEHMGVHTKEMRYTCDICGQQFTFDATLRVHMKWHKDPKPYPCQICGKKFTHTSIRKHHVRKEHTGERPYVCKICGKAFLRTNAIKKHMACHTKIYTFNCKMPNCKAGFMTKHKYGIHLLKVHGDDSVAKERKICEYKVKIRPNALLQPPQTDHTYDIDLNNIIEYIEEEEEEELSDKNESDYEVSFSYNATAELKDILSQ